LSQVDVAMRATSLVIFGLLVPAALLARA
jgi:hypothetical protein